MTGTGRRKILISGASIAGPALAFWLHRHGFDVTVVEKAAAPRTGGYPVDVRGTALEVVRRMGVLPRLRDVHVDLRRMTFIDEHGDEVTSLHPHTVTGGESGHDLEIRRGDLTEALHDAVRDDVEFLFEDSIATLDQHADGVDVTFRAGGNRSFDLVVGADGVHSHTRELVFGPEERFHRYLGFSFGVFTLHEELGLSNEAVVWNAPGKAAALYNSGSDETHALMVVTRPEVPYAAFRDPAAQIELLITSFAGAGWEIPGMLVALRDADDLFFDAVSQIHLPRWSHGRVALVGDAAYAPSFLTGQGTSLALAGAYVLAHSLADRDHTTGFAAYEWGVREFVRLNQALVGSEGGSTLVPATAEALAQRNDVLRHLTAAPAGGHPAHSALTLPEFAPVS
ncbi:2-polyprenyl-6-methoxyphenol hydroxylase [Lentzea fradiae]|uniref:2-polyprenyl-6-methoxyphenol hydroxylase n=1 Tax=Lentzea fradiae TaxID=200378 RepID=A0A1G7R1V3_9PSEU|nr:FAD-dependent monooxygenase [Lentzea fradiae]SDG04694.1 2-polyprenyl-6-methoxyphenol hydroxylase [Lentzea fradiae]